MAEKDQALRRILGTFFAETNDMSAERAARAQLDFIFHMLDWKDELFGMVELYSHPERFSDVEARAIVEAFLVHASSHIVAAARLSDFFLDTFKETR